MLAARGVSDLRLLGLASAAPWAVMYPKPYRPQLLLVVSASCIFANTLTQAHCMCARCMCSVLLAQAGHRPGNAVLAVSCTSQAKVALWAQCSPDSVPVAAVLSSSLLPPLC